MSIDQASDLTRDMLLLSLYIAAPLLGIGLIVGVIVSLFQALTQIQEQTLTFIPKITAMVVMAILIMPWSAQRLIEFATRMFAGG